MSGDAVIDTAYPSRPGASLGVEASGASDPTTPPPPALLSSFRVQLRIIGAIMLRELHTRFGRSNIGYLWLVLEPMILSAGISAFHLFTNVSLPFGFSPGPFYASGYITYIVFRNTVNRAAGVIESNKPLLFHRNVTLLDLTIARVLLDVVATAGAMIVILSIFIICGLSPMPERPWLIFAGLALMCWLSFGVSAMVSGASEFSRLIERFVHPATYLLLPFTGMFYVLDELPPPAARIAALFPFTHISDLVRMGLRSDFNSTYLNLTYVVLFCAITSVLGMIWLKLARRHMHFD